MFTLSGLLQEIAKNYFQKRLQLKLLSSEKQTVNRDTADVTDASNDVITVEHVTFSVVIDAIRKVEPPPTMVAETKKHAEQQILQKVNIADVIIHRCPDDQSSSFLAQDVERVTQRLEELQRSGNMDALPLNRGRAARAKWKAVARMTLLRRRLRVASFEPAIPDQLRVDVRAFCVSFPFHVVFDEDMKVVHSGTKVCCEERLRKHHVIIFMILNASDPANHSKRSQ